MFRSLDKSSCQLLKIWFRIHDRSDHYRFLTRDDLCHFGPWLRELFEVLASLVSQTRFNLVDVVAVTSELVFFDVYSRKEEAMKLELRCWTKQTE